MSNVKEIDISSTEFNKLLNEITNESVEHIGDYGSNPNHIGDYGSNPNHIGDYGSNPNHIGDYGSNRKFEEDIGPEIREEDIADKIKNCIKILPEHYEDISEGVWIKYISSKNKFRAGGLLKINNAPDFFILRNPYNRKEWSMSLEGATIYMRGSYLAKNRLIEKNNLYKLYQAGLVQIMDGENLKEICENNS